MKHAWIVMMNLTLKIQRRLRGATLSTSSVLTVTKILRPGQLSALAVMRYRIQTGSYPLLVIRYWCKRIDLKLYI